MRRVAGLGERGNGKIHRRGFLGCSQPGRSDANLVHRHSRYSSQRLARTADAGAAMHAIDSQREFCHLSFLCLLIR